MDGDVVSTDDAAEIVHVATAPNAMVAEMWAEVLRSADIAPLVQPLGPGPGAWGSSATFEHAIAVRASDVAAAREILHGLDVDGPPADHALDEDAPTTRERSRLGPMLLMGVVVVIIVLAAIAGRQLLP